METEPFLHPELNREITAIGGHYIWVKEGRLPFGDREVLYLVGYAVLDTTCCGVGASPVRWCWLRGGVEECPLPGRAARLPGRADSG